MVLPFSKIDKAELCTFNHADALQKPWLHSGGLWVTAIQLGVRSKIFCQCGREGLHIEVLDQGRTIVINVYEE